MHASSPKHSIGNTSDKHHVTATIAASTTRRLTSHLQHLTKMSHHAIHTHAPSSAQPAPWRVKFLEHIALPESPEFVLSTLHHVASNSPAHPPTPVVPRARFCIYRGMFAELPPNKHNDGPFNPHVYESDCPTFTTDVRTEKVHDLFATGPGHGVPGQDNGSGGGRQVEAVFWVKGKGFGEGMEIMTQWRVRGDAYLLAGDMENEKEQSSGVRAVKSKVGERMRLVPGKEGEMERWSWQREIDVQWANLSPGMRGSFRNPQPGSRQQDKPKEGEGVGLKSGTEDEDAKKNFRVVVIRPFEVEQLDLKDPANARRWKYTFKSEGHWTTEELWP